MKCSNEEIKSLICGAVRFIENEKGITPLRFTPEQYQWYYNNPSFTEKVLASSGMRIDFTTDAEEIRILYTALPGSSRKCCYFDIYLDQVLVQHCGMENLEENPDGVLYLKTDGAPHRVTIYLPNLSGVCIREMELCGKTFLNPEKREKKLLVFGDSITQGYDAWYPSFSYINRVADHFGMELINKAVGGDTFKPEMAAFEEEFVPERIFIAYGTNDWSKKKKIEFEQDTAVFFRNLRSRFPEVPMHVLLPIWREDCQRETFVGSFGYAEEFIRQTCMGYQGIQVIRGFDLFPRISTFFSDHYLHPNDTGFLLMAARVIEELEKAVSRP